MNGYLAIALASVSFEGAVDLPKTALAEEPGAVSVIGEQVAGAKTRPELKKDNPQREYLTNINSEYYQKALQRANEIRLELLKGWEDTLMEIEKSLKIAETEGDVEKIEGYKKSFSEVQEIIGSCNKKFILKDIEDPNSQLRTHYNYREIFAPEEAQNAFKVFDEQRKLFANRIYSDEYKRRARDNEKLSEEQIADRRARALLDIRLDDIDDTRMNDFTKVLNKGGNDGIRTVYGFYDPKSDDVTLRFGKTPFAERVENKNYLTHELTHRITRGNDSLSKLAKKLYHKAFIKTGNKGIDDYLGDPTELDARRSMLIADLEKSEIWKYGENFTEDILKKALELKKEGNLSEGSAEFLSFIDNEKIPAIMNMLAENKVVNTGDERTT